MTDEGIHEIQLNGKQLVFLFMAATVVFVVIFLCGVMVGRGLPPGARSAGATTADAGIDPTAPLPAASTAGVAAAEGLPVAAAETLTYASRLEDPTLPPETLREPVALVEEPPPVSAAAPPAPAEARTEPSSAEPAGSGFVVQVAALPRPQADSVARRLSSKGYPAFVATPGAGAPNLFRVRVGKYSDRREAEAVAGRLQKEEQFKTWITR